MFIEGGTNLSRPGASQVPFSFPFPIFAISSIDSDVSRRIPQGSTPPVNVRAAMLGLKALVGIAALVGGANAIGRMSYGSLVFRSIMANGLAAPTHSFSEERGSVRFATTNVEAEIERVSTGVLPTLNNLVPSRRYLVLVGILGQSAPLMDTIMNQMNPGVSSIEGQ